jgi:hypothetical protein
LSIVDNFRAMTTMLQGTGPLAAGQGREPTTWLTLEDAQGNLRLLQREAPRKVVAFCVVAEGAFRWKSFGLLSMVETSANSPTRPRPPRTNSLPLICRVQKNNGLSSKENLHFKRMISPNELLN